MFNDSVFNSYTAPLESYIRIRWNSYFDQRFKLQKKIVTLLSNNYYILEQCFLNKGDVIFFCTIIKGAEQISYKK